MLITDPIMEARLADIYRKGWAIYFSSFRDLIPPDEKQRVDHAGDNASLQQASHYGSLLPSVWSFMLAARARGLGTCWTTLHLFFEVEAATVLGIPYETVTQAALIPVAHTLGDTLSPCSAKARSSLTLPVEA